MYKRNISALIKEALKDTPAIFINGARQTGKSTLVQIIAQDYLQTKYVTLDDPTILAAASLDPMGFIMGLGKRAIIDEAQRAPGIFLPIKKLIDQNRIPGRFLLTGSANILTLSQITESLAGRVEIHNLWSLSQGEINARNETFIETIFNEDIPSTCTHTSWQEICSKLVKGGFPEPMQRNSSTRRDQWFKSYLTSVLQKDLRDLANIEKLNSLPNLLHLLSYRAANLLNFADVSRVSGITETTLKRYMKLLETVFLVIMLPAWYSNKEKRLIKTPKIYLSDTGFLCHIHQINEQALLNKTSVVGAILENFVVMELIKQKTWSNIPVNIFHFRAQNGREVDIVLESADGRISGVEVKSSSTINAKDFSGLLALSEIAGNKFHRGIIFYTGEQVVSFSKNLHAVPLAALWEW